MKWCFSAGIFAFAVLSAAAVWMGGINQDEGWYLYAANLVADGKMPYRDFFFTQGPLMPIVYSIFAFLWGDFGLLGGRIFTWLIGSAGIAFMAATARNLAPKEYRAESALIAFVLLATNLYHLYFISMPKTYALASLFAAIGFWLMTLERRGGMSEKAVALVAGLALAFAAGTRISLALLPVAAGLVMVVRRDWRFLTFFSLGAVAGMLLVYGPFLADSSACSGLAAAQRYHAARGDSPLMMTVGSLSRLVRWYLPVFAVVVIGFLSRRPSSRSMPLLLGFLFVFVLQILAPFPYEDYQVPIMGLLAAIAGSLFAGSAAVTKNLRILLVLGMSYAVSFGSPLLEKWTVVGQDRFWPVVKEKCELSELREVARKINKLDPGGKTLFTQDTYLAVETGRRVPPELAMGPFSMLTDAEWRKLISEAPSGYPVAALSGYTFAIDPPACSQRPINLQMEYWKLVKNNYTLVDRAENFGQNSTPLLILKKK